MKFEGQEVLALVLHNKAAPNLVLKTMATFSLLMDLPSVEGLVGIAHLALQAGILSWLQAETLTGLIAWRITMGIPMSREGRLPYNVMSGV